MMGAVTTFFYIAASAVHTTDTGSDFRAISGQPEGSNAFYLSKDREPKCTCPVIYCIEDLSMYQIYNI